MENGDDQSRMRPAPSARAQNDNADWSPWSQVWKLLPGDEEAGFIWEILGKYDPKLVRETRNVAASELMKKLLPSWSVLIDQLVKTLRSGVIEVRGQRASVSVKPDFIRPESWQYLVISQGPLLSENRVFFGTDQASEQWLNVEVRKKITSTSDKSTKPEKKQRGRKRGHTPAFQRARTLAEAWFKKYGVPGALDGSQAALVEHIQDHFTVNGDDEPGRSRLNESIPLWAAEWTARPKSDRESD